MDVRKKLKRLLMQKGFGVEGATIATDHLIANGITFAEDNNVPSKWIPVTERLPKEDEDVITLCYWHESWQVQVCHRSSNWPGLWYTSIAGQWVPSVSHWMPLPQPPKGE